MTTSMRTSLRAADLLKTRPFQDKDPRVSQALGWVDRYAWELQSPDRQ